MTDDPFDRLAGLAPEVDAAALAPVHTAARARRRRLRALGVAATVLVGAGTWAAIDHGSGHEGVVAVSPDTTARSGPVSRTVTHDGVRLDVTVDPGELVVGERATVSVMVTNVADGARAIGDFGHCGGPGRLVDEALWPTGNTIVPTWDPSTSLADALRRHQPNPPPLSDPGIVACAADFPNFTLEPGTSQSWSGALDVRTGNGPTHPVLLRLGVAGATVEGTRTSVTTDIVLPLADRPARQASYEAALAAFAADPRLHAFTIPDPDRRAMPGLDQIQTDLSWWHGAWELWLFSGGHGAGRLRLRYNPATGLVDATTVPIGTPAP